jgi:N-carbamoylputrescine amidase
VEKKMRIAGVQLGAYQQSYEKNMEQILSFSKKIIDSEKPDLLVFSELMTAPYFAAVPTPDDKFFEYAEFMVGPTVERVKELASSTNTHIVGTFFEKERVNGSTHYYNTAFVCSPTRGVIGRYRKVHIPKVDVESMKTDEKYYFEGGTEFPVFTLDNGFRMGILICFDRSFPEAWKALTLQGVDLIVVPTATYGFRKDLYVEELRVRALENNIYVMGVNKAGFEQLPEEGIPRTHFGQSCLIDPFGEKIAVAGEQEWTYVTGEIISAEIEKSKQRVNFLKERKREVYQKYITNVNVFAKN